MVKVAILHEGHADKSLDNWLLKELTAELAKENPVVFNWNRVQCYGMQGKSTFFDITNVKYSDLLPQIIEDQITKVLFVIDADCHENDAVYGGYHNTLNQWQTLVMNQLNIAEISDIFISCDPITQTGYVESLLLSTLDDDKKTCIETFLACSDFQQKDNAKAILRQIYKTAYPKAPYDLQHEHFDELKQKLRILFS